ncbi:hypothetical protein H696_03803 [Fonticula alba]|uniref:Uncharacterized protein n=1 Tax=Fonticula alba TaxID=691883 RepID=A0A058Z526_FONAL|nr:hypothetical protein H696_03803 [Fonticula alba]KCV69370.1 hypothetical protein H696_03803 [Fonticula alba]|eukprot:XP_009495935.1 hypothetical protein H696_03803 [Fonticula alba]
MTDAQVSEQSSAAGGMLAFDSATIATYLQTFHIELLLILFLAAYGAFYLRGNSRNQHLAHTYAKALFSSFKNQFAYFGDGKGHLLIQDSPSQYWFYASGRVHFESLAVGIQLKRRMDIVGLLTDEVTAASHDRVVFTAQVSAEAAPKFVLLAGHTKRLAALSQDRGDVASFAGRGPVNSRKLAGLEDLAILCESTAIAEALFEPAGVIDAVAGLLRDGALVSLHISDQPSVAFDAMPKGTPPRLQVTMVMNLIPELRAGQSEAEAITKAATTAGELAIYLVDRIATMDLPANVVSQLAKKRTAVTDGLLHKERQEQSQARRQERIDAQLEQAKSQGGDALEKLENKLKKKEQKKMVKNLKVR